MNPLIVVTHAAFDQERRRSLQRLVSQLRIEAPDVPFRIISDIERKGSLWCWLKAMHTALADPTVTHVVWLPDDVTLCKDYGRVLRACIEARPDDVWDGFVNHPKPKGWGILPLWYSTVDGYTGVSGVMPRGLLQLHLEWRTAEGIPDTMTNDGGVNLWAMATGRLIYKTSFSLCQHDTSLPSLDGHGDQDTERAGSRPIDSLRHGVFSDTMNLLGRTYMAPEEHEPGVKTSCEHVGRTYACNHIALLSMLKPPRIERYWDVERGHGLTGKKKVFIVLPGHHRGIDDGVVAALIREIFSLMGGGWEFEVNVDVRDSHVNRVRNRAVSWFLHSDASHLLFWDRDNYPTEPGAILKLLETGHDVVGGAVPLKDGTGTRFAFQLGLHAGEHAVEMNGHSLAATHVGTGFLLVSRHAVVKLATALHKEAFYVSGMEDSVNRAEWFLFADAVRDQKHLSEDWEFCRKWHDIGGTVYMRPDIDFFHVGEHPYHGSFDKTFGTEAA